MEAIVGLESNPITGQPNPTVYEIETGLMNIHFHKRTMSPQQIHQFLSSLPFASRSERLDDFPLVLQHDGLEKAVEAWLSRLKPTVVRLPTKENQPILMTSAPTGSGKTIFLRLLCQLFRHGWDVDNFIDSLRGVDDNGDNEGSDEYQTPSAGAATPSSGTAASSSKITWLQALRQAIETIKSSNKIKKLIKSGDLAKSFLTSTHPCFVSFSSTSPITEFETQWLGHSPELMLIARIIFAELKPASPTSTSSFASLPAPVWPILYDAFLAEHSASLLQLPPSLHHIVDFFREKSGCKHYMLAIDEVMLLDGDSDTIRQEPLAAALGDAVKTVRTCAASTAGVSQVLKAVGKVVMTDPRCAAIVSSLTTGPLDEYVRGPQHLPVFIPLPPFLDSLTSLAEIIVQRRGDDESFHPVMRMLLATGGHPKLLYKLIPWLSDADLPCGDMTFGNAAEICDVKQGLLSEPNIANAILTGDPVHPALVAETSGLGGMLTRPTSWSSPSIIIASPLVLYTVASRHPACCKGPSGQRGLKIDDLVPSEIRSGEEFAVFIAAWLTLRLRMGASLAELLADDGVNLGYKALRASVKVPHIDSIHAFVDWDTFIAALPTAETKVTLEMAQRTSAFSGGQRLFGMDGLGSSAPVMRVAVPVARQNPGFDILVGKCGGDEKRVLLIQCKAQEVDSGENEDQTFNHHHLAHIITQSVANAGDLIHAGWTVTLLVIASCQTSSTVVSDCTVPVGDGLHLFERTGVIGKAALRNLLGASFVLALESAQGHVGGLYQNK